MNRRQSILALLVFGGAPAALAQQGGVRRIGFLDSRAQPSPANPDPYIEAFLQQLRELGYVEGKTIAIEWRFAAEKNDRLAPLAEELVRQQPDLLVSRGTPAAVALKKATSTIPIIATVVTDPIGDGLAKSLARPGGNLTGLSTVSVDAGPKQLELLKAVLPGLARVAVLVNPGNPAHRIVLKSIQSAGESVGIKSVGVSVRSRAEMDDAFAAMAREKMPALIVAADAVFIGNRRALSQLALRERIPMLFPYRDAVPDGSLMSYGPNLAAIFRRAAVYVDKVLKGARASELPIEQPSQLELAINLTTARTLGVTIPKELLFRADLIVD